MNDIVKLILQLQPVINGAIVFLYLANTILWVLYYKVNGGNHFQSLYWFGALWINAVVIFLGTPKT